MSVQLPRAASRVLARISEQQTRAPSDEILQRLAWLTVYHAAAGDAQPFERARRQLRDAWGFQLDCERPPIPESTAAEPSVDCVDGRTGDQWMQSAIDYLRWRAGDNWRRTSQRRAPECAIYSGAIHLLTQTTHAPHNGPKLAAFQALRPAEPPAMAQLPLHFPARRVKTKSAAA